MDIFQASNLRKRELKKLSSPKPIASIGVIKRTTSQQPFHFACAPTRCRQAAGHLTRKEYEHAYDAARAVLIFFSHVFYVTHQLF